MVSQVLPEARRRELIYMKWVSYCIQSPPVVFSSRSDLIDVVRESSLETPVDEPNLVCIDIEQTFLE